MDILPPKRLEKPLQVPNRLLMGPGPSNCSPRVLQAMGQPTLGHMHPECFEIMDDIKEGIRYVFQTRNELTLAISASGHGGMEAVLCNLLESGDTVLVAVNGYWGERASDMASRYGANVVKVEAEPGDNFTLSKIEQAIVKHDPDVLFIVQGDSSTGVFQNLEGIGDICRRSDVLFVVDSVASLGAVPLFTDKWGIDAIYSGSQKVLGAPPGLAPISFSPRAQRKMFNRNSPVKVFYWDMTVLGHYWGCFEGPRIYHHTISSHLLYGLREALAILTVEGLENVIERHQRCSQRLYEGLKRLKLQFFVEEVHKRLPTVTAIIVPPCVVGHEVIDYAMEKHSLEIAGGLGPTANKVFRIGLMGYNATFEKTDFFLKVLTESLDYARSKKKNISKL